MPLELNLATTIEAVAARVPARAAFAQGEHVLTYRRFVDRATRFARFLADHGLGATAERPVLAGHQAGQHLLAQYLHNGPEYLEGMVGAYRARVAPFNVNYRYQREELLYLLLDADPSVIQYHARFGPTLAPVLDGLGHRPLLVRVDDGSGEPPLPGSLDYEQVLAAGPASVAAVPSPDDLYVIYTGGTTGMPKGVLWRQADVAVSTLGLRNRRAGREWDSLDELLDGLASRPRAVLPCAPLMHGAAQWAALQTFCDGGTVVFPEHAENFDAERVLAAVARHRVAATTIVGDAFARPLIEALERGAHDTSSLRVVVSGGAALRPAHKRRLMELVPGLRVLENIGSSESGIQGSQESDHPDTTGAPEFDLGDSSAVVSADLTRFLEPGHEGTGWLATKGRIPLGYLGDADKTARTFPVVAGVRVSIPGDRARLLTGGRVRLLGRDSMTINTGGEKVFAEEVEAVLKDHPDVADALVSGRPSDRWGAEVAGLVVPTRPVAPEDLIAFCRTRLSAYKVPKALLFVDHVERGPSGKPDYRWAAARLSQPETVASTPLDELG